MTKPNEEIEVFVTRYALRAGVTKARGNVYPHDVGKSRPSFLSGSIVFNHVDWHVTEAAAVQRVREMVRIERAALKRKADRLNEIDSLIRRGSLPMEEIKPR